MQDKELYQHILGLTSPWTVSGVKLDIPAEEIQVRVEHPAGTKFCCPECQKELACYDHAEECHFRSEIEPICRFGWPATSILWRDMPHVFGTRNFLAIKHLAQLDESRQLVASKQFPRNHSGKVA